MKTYILTILVFFLGILSIHAQYNDIHVYIKNGEINSFFRERIDSITTKNGLVQNVWTIDSLSSTTIENIDSVCFGKRELPTSITKFNVAGWSDVTFYNNGLVAYHTDRSEFAPEKSLLLIPDEKEGIISCYTVYDENSEPSILTFEDDVIFISKDENGSPTYTIAQGDSIVCKFVLDSDKIENYKKVHTRAISDNNWQRNLIATGKIICGLGDCIIGGVIIIGGVAEFVPSFGWSSAGILLGTKTYLGGQDLVASGLTTLFVPATESSKGTDNYVLNSLSDLGFQTYSDWILDDKDIISAEARDKLNNVNKKGASYLFYIELVLNGADQFFGETITKADRIAKRFSNSSVITGTVRGVTPYSATVLGYVSPDLMLDENGKRMAIDYGIIVAGKGGTMTKSEKNGNGGLIEFEINNLIPSSEYTYVTYVWNQTYALLYFALPNKNFKTPALPLAMTGYCTDINKTSATVYTCFENVPEDGVCGVEYTWKGGEKSIDEGSFNGEKHITINGLVPGTSYDYRAFVKVYGQTYYGETKSFTTESVKCNVLLSDFKVTKSQYKEGAFTNDGKKYNFRFDTSVTGIIEIEDMSYVKEWGYVYEDPDGKTKEVPLTGTKETVTRYAYFRNSATSTARLYGYAYIEGIESPIYYEVHDFPLVHNMAVANTGEYSNVTTSTATVLCSFENVPEGATCGIEYTDGNNWNKQSVNDINKDGSHTVTLTDLQSGTKYEYRAFIDDAGQMYYGGQLDFTTGTELPDLTGTWNCTIYNDDDSILAECKYEFSSDHKVTHDGSDRIPEGEIGSWSIDANGKVGVNFSWAGGSWSHPVWYAETYSGQANSASNPLNIEGTVYRAWAGTMSEHGDTYRFKMTK